MMNKKSEIHIQLCDEDETDCENYTICCFDCTKERCVWRCKGTYEDCIYHGVNVKNEI